MKCYICMVYEARNDRFPNSKYLKEELGHDLSSLSKRICQKYFNKNDISVMEEDYSFLVKDELLQRIIHILSEFGKFTRYYNIDVITGSQKSLIDPKEDWEELERSIEDPTPYLGPEALFRDYYPGVNNKIIARIERFIRAIAMQFTLGRHGGKLQQYSHVFGSFRNLTDDELGTIDYRRSVMILQRKKENWIRRTEEEIKESPWPTKKFSKGQFTGEWPFRSDEVIIECREGLFCIVNIQSYDFALNGAAASRYEYPFPHDAGEAVLGKSVGPFIEMALELRKSSAGDVK